MRLDLLMLAIMLAGCSRDTISGEHRIYGYPMDVKTQPGSYDGYEVLGEDCGWDGSPLVRNPSGSRGTNWPDVHTLIDRMAHLDVREIGTADICEHLGSAVELNDWRDIDEAIAIIGAYLVEADIGEPFFVTVKDTRDWSGSGRGLCCENVGSARRR